MKTTFLALSALALSGCATAPQMNAGWWQVCPEQSLRVTEHGSTLKQYTSGCHVSDKEPVEQVSIRAFTADLPSTRDAYYLKDEMIWINPDRDDYQQATAGLTNAVFPFETETECRAAGRCTP